MRCSEVYCEAEIVDTTILQMPKDFHSCTTNIKKGVTKVTKKYTLSNTFRLCHTLGKLNKLFNKFYYSAYKKNEKKISRYEELRQKRCFAFAFSLSPPAPCLLLPPTPNIISDSNYTTYFTY